MTNDTSVLNNRHFPTGQTEESMVWLEEEKVNSGKEDCPRDTSPDLPSSKAGPSALSLFWSQDIS